MTAPAAIYRRAGGSGQRAGGSGQRVEPAARIGGTFVAPPDKSISHRALFLLTIAEGTGLVTNLLDADDVASTLGACRALGAAWEMRAERTAQVRGLGREGLVTPAAPIDAGNSGTTARLLFGLAAGAGVGVEVVGDASLSKRPMERVAEPLRKMGAEVELTEGCLPGRVRPRTRGLRALRLKLPVASAQVASAVLLAGCFAEGETEVELPAPARDHTPRLLRYLGAEVEFDARRARLRGPADLVARPIAVPGDPSSAAFFLILAVAAGASVEAAGEVRVPNLLCNPTRTGFLRVMQEMNARVEIEALREEGPESVGTVVARGGGRLRGVEVPPEAIPSLLDEVPLLAVLAAFAEGETRFAGVGELRVKETDRVAAVVEELGRVGVRARVEVKGDREDLVVEGRAGEPLPGGRASSRGDHRIAMALAVAGALSRGGVEVEGADCVRISYPDFFDDLARATGRVGRSAEGAA